MIQLLDLYLEQVKNFVNISSDLHKLLDTIIKLKSVDQFGFRFHPTESSIQRQLSKWPEEASFLPPAAWVDPRGGIIEYKGDHWEFAFHGQGVSFFNCKTNQDVSIEYTIKGE